MFKELMELTGATAMVLTSLVKFSEEFPITFHVVEVSSALQQNTPDPEKHNRHSEKGNGCVRDHRCKNATTHQTGCGEIWRLVYS